MFVVSDGLNSSTPAVVSIEVMRQPAHPSEIELSTLRVPVGTGAGELIALVRAVDPNPGDQHTFSLVGAAQDNARFLLEANRLMTAPGFLADTDGEQFQIRIQAEDQDGLSLERTFVLTATHVPRGIVINEIHYNPADNTLPTEFVELFNPGTDTVDLSGWWLGGGVSYIFPPGTLLPPHEYLVVASDPVALRQELGAEALGPWSGVLSNEGERITLRNAGGRLLDEVDYRPEFPWPIGANGSGGSMELLHPLLDNDLGSSWATSPSPPEAGEPRATWVPAADANWRYRKGTNEPSISVGAWRLAEFSEDHSWSVGRTPVGYGDNDDNTPLVDMRNNFATVYLRHAFTLEETDLRDRLELRLYVDDGAILWINGREIARVHMDEGEVAYNDIGAARDHEVEWETLELTGAMTYLTEGENLLAIQAMNRSLGSSDFSIDAELGTPTTPLLGPQPSPGRANGSFQFNAAPNIRQVRHTPKQPGSSDMLLIAAKVTDPEGVKQVDLDYQVVSAGQYVPSVLPRSPAELTAEPTALPSPNPLYASGWTTVSMFDDGTLGDATAGDDVYSVQLPPQSNRSLLRYRITVTDRFSASRRAPFGDDPSMNFAVFVYDGIPDYQGTSAATLAGLPVYFLLTRAEDLESCTAYNSSDQLPQTVGGNANEARFAFNWIGTFVYDGVVYDHVRYRLRGANGRYQPGKRNFRIRFNDGHYLQAHDLQGVPYPRKWSVLNTGKGQSNRQTLTFGLNEVVNYFLFNTVGVPAPRAHFFHFRVIDGRDEAPDPYDGDFWGLNWAQENYDVRFLESHNLSKGNLYKLINSVRTGPEQLRYQAASAVSDGSDMVNIEQNLTGNQSTSWLLAHVNYPNWYRYHGICEGIRHYDFWPSANKNAGWYFEPPYLSENGFFGRMWTLPWDTDSSWGPTWNLGHDVVYNGIFPSGAGGGDAGANAELQVQYRNAVRELRDLLFQRDQIEPLVRSFGAAIEAFATADLARWTLAPAVTGNYRSLASPGPALSQGVSGYVEDMLRFMFTGGSWPGGDVASGGQVVRLDRVAQDPKIPQRPSLTAIGPAGFPVDGLRFRSSSFVDPQGTSTFAAMEWRAAEVLQPGIQPSGPGDLLLEWNAAWTSGELPAFLDEVMLPPTAVQPGKRYRVRVRHRDTSGRWSHWSAAVEVTPTPVDLISDLRSGLVFSEIMYHPPPLPGIDSSDLEFLELENLGGKALDLGGLFFSSGIDFTFPLGTTLAPGDRFLLGRDPESLHQRYPELTIDGIYQGRLDDDGERVTLSHPHGEIVLSVTYDDRLPWPATTDGLGFSLVRNEMVATGYSPSTDRYGSPGIGGAAALPVGIVVNEVLTASTPPLVDAVELMNLTEAPIDVGGWWLSDNPSAPEKYRFPFGTTLKPGGFLVVTEHEFGLGGASTTGFALSSFGDEVLLFAADPAGDLLGYVHGLAFPGAADGVSYGRWALSSGEEHAVPEENLTLGEANSGPRRADVAITEIHYVPAPSAAQFIELRNTSWKPIELGDQTPPPNTWKLSGFSFSFPEDVVLAPGGFALVTGVDPALFRARHNIAEQVPIFGTSGVLQTAGEWLRLQAPDAPTTDGVPYFPVDQVRYGVNHPWPVLSPDGSQALQRVDFAGYGGEPVNWSAAEPTPGLPWPGSRPMLALGVELDPRDDLPNLLVYAEAGRSFTVEFADNVSQPVWLKLSDLATAPTNRVEVLRDPAQLGARFYRVVTPARP
jgi:hypothetical protein